MCFLVGERGAKEELISKGFVFLHECFLASPIKAFIDLDFPPSIVSTSDFEVMTMRAENWINKFKIQVNKALTKIMISIKVAEKKERSKSKNPRGSYKNPRGLGEKGARKELAKFKHEWSVQAAHRLPDGKNPSKISYHVVNNSSYDGKPLLFADIVHLDRFLRGVQREMGIPNGFKIDNTFTYKGKTLRCIGGAKRSEPSRVFVEIGSPGKPFSFGCVQPDALDFEHYVISTVCPSMTFDDLYPETDFLPGCGRQKNSGGGGGSRGMSGNSRYSCTIKRPSTPESTAAFNTLIRCVAEYLASVKEYQHVACGVSKNAYTMHEGNIKSTQDFGRVDVGIRIAPRTSCLLGNRQHSEGKGSTSLQLRVMRGLNGDFFLELRCRGGVSDGHPRDTLDVGHLGGGDLSMKSEMLTAAEIALSTIEGKPKDQNYEGCEDNDD